MFHVLMIEDSLETQKILAKILTSIGAEVSVACSLEEARKKLAEFTPSMILLDICLPDGDGFHFCGEIVDKEETRAVPFIFISGKEDVTTKVAAFSLGAEDYIVKPFNVMELKARLDARIKKITAQQNAKLAITKGALRIDASKQRAWIKDGQSQTLISLTPREFKILFHLVQNEENVLSRDQLLEAVWGNDSSVFDRTVDTHISAIRKKLGAFSTYIESVPGSGYRFTVAEDAKKRSA